MSDTYKILYRHMKIVTPEPNSETYDCWMDGRANTVSLRREDEYGIIHPIETMPLDEAALEKRFEGAYVTVLGTLSEVSE